MSSTPSPTHKIAWSQRPFDAATVAVVAMASGVLIWNALFPGFYYMANMFFVGLFWVGLAVLLGCRMAIAANASLVSGRPVVWNGWRGVALLAIGTTLLLLTKAPLHVAFALAHDDFDNAIAKDVRPEDEIRLSKSDYGLYSILQLAHRSCHDQDRIYFRLASDSEAGFVYSPNGVDDLCYNSGTTGHLSGNWYWMVED